MSEEGTTHGAKGTKADGKRPEREANLGFARVSSGGLVAGDDHIPTLDELRIEGKACAARIRRNERLTNLTTRDTLIEWFDQAHRWRRPETSHGLKGSTFEQFAFEIGVNGKWCYDIELLDGYRDIVFTRCEELEREGSGSTVGVPLAGMADGSRNGLSRQGTSNRSEKAACECQTKDRRT